MEGANFAAQHTRDILNLEDDEFTRKRSETEDSTMDETPSDGNPELPSAPVDHGTAASSPVASPLQVDPMGPEPPSLSLDGIELDEDDTEDDGMRPRSRSKSFYQDQPEEETGDLDSDEFDMMSRGRSRSRSMHQSNGVPEPPSRGMLSRTQTPRQLSAEEEKTRSLKENELQALEQGLKESARNMNQASIHNRQRKSVPNIQVKSGVVSERLHSDTGDEVEPDSPPQRNYDRRIKLLMLGDVSVGKTSLMSRWTEDVFHDSLEMTAGVDFKTKTIEMDNERVHVQVWDTAGQERFHQITRSYYKGCNGILLVFDVTSPDHIVQRIQYWLDNINSHANQHVCTTIMCNKSDLLTQQDTIIHKKVKELEKDYPNTPFFLTSARTGDNVENAFDKVVETVVSRQKARHSDGMSLGRPRSEGKVIVGCRCTVS